MHNCQMYLRRVGLQSFSVPACGKNIWSQVRSKRLTKKKKEKHEELLLFTSIAGFRGKYSCSAYFDASFTVSVGVYYSDGFFFDRFVADWMKFVFSFNGKFLRNFHIFLNLWF